MKSRYITAIDIGSSKTAAIVGENTATGIRIIAYSEVPSEGVVRGEVIKSQKVANAVSAVLQDVREQLQSVPEADSYRIRKVYANISGQNIRCVPGTVHRERQDPDSSITKEEINSMLDEMYQMKAEPSEQVLYVAPQCYNVDEHMGETDPEDMDGQEIDGEYKVFIGKASAVNHCKSAFDRINLDVKDLILTPIASGAALLTEDEKELGSVLVDIGAGTTGVLIYQADILRYAAVIPFGGDSVTEDISQTCSISRKNAEQLKIQKGTCISEFAKDTVLTIKESGVTVKGIPSKQLSSAIEARVCEILATVRHIIEISGFKNKLRSRAVLTGGSTNLPLIQLLAKNILGMDVRIGFPDSNVITGNSVETVFRPQASTAVGLILEGFRLEELSDDNDGYDIYEAPDTPKEVPGELFPDTEGTAAGAPGNGQPSRIGQTPKKKSRNPWESFRSLFDTTEEDNEA
ncbi:MAG TPA: cell division protein FtsA [Candidatus Coprenecus stercoravium]|uniref:Cell division protein FtsA n=1 Tax=Candidatus Coprenecus stercoravium TaxID=2840735 RepID=A0A9D2GSC6_9BACT|nr:cell division protein FtsA [Candidatus Coprenecus stercoravium]